MEPARIAVFDTETTGTDPQADQIIELTIQTGLGPDAPQRTWRFLPQRPISPGAERVHGISLDDLRGCPAFSACAAEVADQLDAAQIWIGYNLRFDLDIIQAELVRSARPKLALEGRLLIDPFRLWQRMEPRSLTDAHKRFVGDAFDGAHGAAADVAATGRVLQGMLSTFGLQELDWSALADRIEPERRTWIGPTNHLTWNADGDVAIGFGKHRGKVLRDFVRDSEGRDYVHWMLRSDFPAHVKEVLDSLRRSTDRRAWSDDLAQRHPRPPATYWAAPDVGGDA